MGFQCLIIGGGSTKRVPAAYDSAQIREPWCPGGVLVVSQWCPGVPVVSWWCPGGVRVMCPGGVPVTCPGGIPAVFRWRPDGFLRVSLYRYDVAMVPQWFFGLVSHGFSCIVASKCFTPQDILFTGASAPPSQHLHGACSGSHRIAWLAWFPNGTLVVFQLCLQKLQKTNKRTDNEQIRKTLGN